jgi:hypothetical protein
MLSATSRSAIVRATFRMRSCARAERPSRVMAFSNSFSPSGVIAQYLRIILGSQVVLALLTQGTYASGICQTEQLRSLRKGES